jgi:predicted acetylornithine/succinylornithine family transaminase
MPKTLPSTEDIRDRDAQYILGTYKRKPVAFVEGEGSYLIDCQGKRYLDFGSGIAVHALGHKHPAVVAAIHEQSQRLLHTSNLYYTQPMVDLAEQLASRSFGSKVFFCNSGTEANEAALKFARRHALKLDGSGKKKKFVCFRHGFHGRTIGALSVTPKPAIQDPFRPLLGDVITLDFNDAAMASRHIDREVAGVIVEPVQGEGGIHLASSEFMRSLRAACDRTGAALIFDEVQCGLGRTGKLWAYEHFGVAPDMMTLAKPLGGGLPLGAVIVHQQVASSIQPGDHGSTFGANPLATRVGLAVLEVITQPGFLETVAQHAHQLEMGLRDLHRSRSSEILAVRGIGLMWGLDVKSSADTIIDQALSQGLIILSAGERTLRLLPPLNVNADEIESMLATLRACFA